MSTAFEPAVTIARPREGAVAPLIAGLATRWQRARCEALRTVVPDAPADADEATLLSLANARDPEASLRRVFDNSRVLGLGFRRYHGIDLTLVDLSTVLHGLGAPCHTGGFQRVEGEPACTTAASPCAGWSQAPALCDHWRESIHGLIGGLSSTVYFTRVASPGGGGAECVDLLHVNAQSARRFAPVSMDIQVGIDAIIRWLRAIDPGAKIEFYGLVEGALHYRAEGSAKSQPACGTCATASACGLDVHVLLERALARRFPDLRLCDASPRPVFTA